MDNMLGMFTFPPLLTELVFGFGAVRGIGQRVKALGGSKALVVTDPGVKQAGLLKQVEDALNLEAVPYAVYAEVPQDSSTTTIAEALASLNSEGCDIVIGLGGGSSMDTAKAVAISKTNPGSIEDYAGLEKLRVAPLPVIAVPTTAGTGSEVSYWSVMTDDRTGLKISVGGKMVFPEVAICDPDLTMSLPPGLTASTGMDALTHAIESFVNNATQPVSKALSLRAIELIGKYLRSAATNGNNREARYGMMLGSTLAGIAMNPTRLGIAHALAMPLGSWHLKIPHGLANAITLPHVMAFNLPGNVEGYAAVARALGERVEGLSCREAADRAVSAVRQLNEDVGIVHGLGHYGLTEEDVPKVVEEAMKSGNMQVNPRKATADDLKRICLQAM